MITNDDLARMEHLLVAPPAGNPFAEFRHRFPGLSLTRCDVQDMSGESPFREFPKFNLYLVDGRDHCWHLTSDPAAATGFVVAARN